MIFQVYFSFYKSGNIYKEKCRSLYETGFLLTIKNERWCFIDLV